ncbi:MAG: CopG family transcriptional regulator [Desulfotalea sp.]|nr:MAG: CopG family transcriptional regulator [Desulfotalea sp.]
MTKEKKKSTSLRLDAKVLKELKLLAVEQETSLQAIVEALVKNYIEKNKLRR